MDKVICDICGTAYQESEECCPVCGSSREYAVQNEEFLPGPMPRYIPENRENDQIYGDSAMEEYEEPYEEEPVTEPFHSEFSPEPRRPKMGLVIIFTVLITVFTLAIAFLFFSYVLPSRIQDDPEPVVTEETVPSESLEEETTIPTVPCSSIALTAGVPEITRIGQYWLLHVIVTPENTTDTLNFISSDESVVTVTAEGRLCAVGEGETTVLITCGSEQILCPVTVRIPETEPPTEATEEPSDSSEATEAQTLASTEPVTEAQQTGATELKLKDSDLTFTKKGVTRELPLDCDLKPEDVKWLTLDPNVALCHDGVVTIVGPGMTKIVAQYNGQEAVCIIRCNF